MRKRYATGWIIGLIIGLIIFTGMVKVMQDILNADTLKIIMNAMFQGLGAGVGIYLANRLLIEHLEKRRNNKNK